MKSLALLSPWPPQHSGIADYAYDLVKMLRRPALRITVFTTQAHPRILGGVEFVCVDANTDFDVLNSFDLKIYQLGNNTDFHLWMIPLLERYPGVVHVHDMVMHHMAAWITWMQGDAEGYLDLLYKWYGEPGLEAGELSLESGQYLWSSDSVTKFPLCEEYLQNSTAILVHSVFALQHMRKTVPHIPSFQIDQLYDLKPRAPVSERVQCISILGGVDPQKRLDWIIEALAGLDLDNAAGHALKVRIIGSVDPRCEYLKQRADAVSHSGLSIEFLGRVDEQDFITLFEETDLCIALRYPTMGETSAIVMKALQLGVPTIVNDIGWYGELPQNIVKHLPVEDCAQALRQLLEYLVRDEVAYRAWSSHCYSFASDQFSPSSLGNRYLELAENPRGAELVTDVFAEVLRECGMTGASEEEPMLNAILTQSLF